jgi:hypothetical protein
MNRKKLRLIVETYLGTSKLLHSEEATYVRCVLILTENHKTKLYKQNRGLKQ